MYIYKNAYTTIDFLNNQHSENFLAWICPLLKQNFIPMDMFIYYESDYIDQIYFHLSGFSGFVLPFKKNIVYIEIHNGDLFGEIDLIASAK